MDHVDYLDPVDHPDQLDHPDHPDRPDHPDHIDHPDHLDHPDLKMDHSDDQSNHPELKTQTHQKFVKKMITEYGLFTWSNFVDNIWSYAKIKKII